MSFADKVAKIADMHEWERDYYEWLKLPTWVRYADSRDAGHGIDGDGMEEDEPYRVPTHAELEKMMGRKLINLKKEGIPY